MKPLARLMLLVLVACDDPAVRPEVVVTIETGAAIRASATHLRIRVYGGGANAQLPGEPRAEFEVPELDSGGVRPALSFPQSFSLTPDEHDASRTYRVVVEARDDAGRVLATTRLIGGYLAGRVLAAMRVFDDACADLPCTDDTTCHDGACVSARVDAGALAAHCDAGSASFEQRCVAIAACASASPCAPDARCGERNDGFLCACAEGFVGDGETGCEPIAPAATCESLAPPEFGSVSPASGVATTIATYRCDADHELVGNSDLATRVCQSSLAWSGSAPVCEPSGGYPGWPVPGTTNHPRTFTVSDAAGLVVDSVTGLTWERDMTPSIMSYASALAYCAALEIEGASDFRVPSRIELLSIVDVGAGAPVIDSAAFPGTQSSEHTWTRTPRLAAPAGGRWTVGFGHGDTYGALETAMRFVRCVR